MTAGKVMSAIKVDMCRSQQPMMPQLNLAAPSGLSDALLSPAPTVLDLNALRNQRRRRGAARVCLFGAPEPRATRVLFDEMLGQQRQYMLDRYAFDMRTDRYVGDERDLQTPDEAATGSSPTADLQERLHGASADPQTVGAAESADETPPADEPNDASENDDGKMQTIKDAVVAGCSTNKTAAVVGGHSKCGKSKVSSSLRQTKPYERPSSSTVPSNVSVTSYRPITEFFRKSKKTCPTASAVASKLHATRSSPADVDSTSAATAVVVSSTTSSSDAPVE